MASKLPQSCGPVALDGVGEAMLEQAGGLFKALGDPSRLRLLQVLLAADEPITQGELAQQAGLSASNASRHLTLLLREGLVCRHQMGTQASFEAAEPVVSEVCGLVCGHVSQRVHANFKSLG